MIDPVILVLVALVLAFVSFLLTIRLRSEGASPGRTWRVLIELWVTFALIIGIFSLVNALIAPTGNQSIGGDFLARLARARSLSTGLQVLIYGGLVLALAMFVRLMLVLRSVGERG
ncbi:MAG: hypothetical protein ACYDBB_14060 [Armatimonadota bacterium]